MPITTSKNCCATKVGWQAYLAEHLGTCTTSFGSGVSMMLDISITTGMLLSSSGGQLGKCPTDAGVPSYRLSAAPTVISRRRASADQVLM